MSTRQRSRPAVASAVHTEWPHMVSAILLLAVTVPPTGFLLLARTPLLLPSMSLNRTRNLSHRRTGRVVLVVRPSRRLEHKAKSRQCIERHHEGNNDHVA